MPYRPYEYVPQPYRPDDSRLTALMLAQSQNEADRIRQQGVSNALMWRGIGDTIQGTLSSLAQYRREAPQRAEEERKRKEADRLRGLQRMAGDYVDPVTNERGMSQSAYGKLLQQEGFMDLGQGYLDKDAERKDKEAEREMRQRDRDQKELSEIYVDLADATADTYPSLLAGFETRYGKEKVARYGLPPVYDEPKVKGLATAFGTQADELQRNNLAISKLQLGKAKRVEEDDYLKDATEVADLMYPIADTAEKWGNVRVNIRNQFKHLPEEQLERILARIPHPVEFSEEALIRARDRDPQRDKSPTPLKMSLKGFRDFYGRDPKTPAEILSVTRLGTSGQGLLDPKDRLTLEADARSDYDQSLKEALDKFGRGTPEFNDFMKSVIDNYGARLAAINGGVGYGGGGVGATTAGGWGSGAAGGATAGGGGSLADATNFQRPGVAPAAGGGQEASAAEIEAALKAGGPQVIVNTPVGPRPFQNQAVADLYLRSIGSGGGAAAGAGGSAAAPDYSQRPDVLYGEESSAAAADYSQRPDVLYGGEGVAADAAAVAEWRRLLQQRAPWDTEPRDPDAFSMFPEANVGPPRPSPPPGPQIAPWMKGGAGNPKAAPPGTVPVTNGKSTGMAHPTELPALAQQGWYPVGAQEKLPMRGGATPQQSEPPVLGAFDTTAPMPPQSEPPVLGPFDTTAPMPPDMPPERRPLSEAAGALRAPVAPPAAVRSRPASVARVSPGPVRSPDTPTDSGMTPRQIIEQMQPKANASTSMQERLNLLKSMMFMAGGYELEAISKVRTAKEQAALYAQGRTKPGPIVTNFSGKPGDESPHQLGLAADFTFLKDGKRLSQNTKGLPWDLLGQAAEKLGLTWGGRWKQPYDPVHVEMPREAGPADPNAPDDYRQSLLNH